MKKIWYLFLLFLFVPFISLAEGNPNLSFPIALSEYNDANLTSLSDILVSRINVHPFNLVATLIFFAAIIHAFLSGKVMALSHKIAHEFEQKMKRSGENSNRVSLKAEILHFLGEVEAVFGIWILPLAFFFIYFEGWYAFVDYVDQVNYTEAMFVFAIMALASTKPIMFYSEKIISRIANIFGGSVLANWFCILTLAPLLGSFITEPAAMTIAALLLSGSFYKHKPKPVLAYATLGLLFVNISIGGTLTHFAAPPVLMVAEAWGWNTPFMIEHIGWKAIFAILISNGVYVLIFRKSLVRLDGNRKFQETKTTDHSSNEQHIPLTIFFGHIAFMIWVVFNAHHPVLFIGGFMFFLAFAQATKEYQNMLSLRGPLLVGFFLAGLVTHGGLQAWWIAPTLSRLSELPLFIGSIGLTAINDNAAITYLATLVPDFTDPMKYAVVTGAVTGGGLTVLANAPNPAGQSILSKHFKFNVSPLKLFLSAFVPTVISGLCFYLL